MLIPVSEWVPDASDLGNPGSIEIFNAIPKPNSYGPFPQLVSVSDALPAYPRGAIEAKDDDGTVFQFAGDETGLYRLAGSAAGDSEIGHTPGGHMPPGHQPPGHTPSGTTSGLTWVDVSKSGGYATGSQEIWRFVRWRNTVIASNFSDVPQTITFGANNFADLTTALRFRHMAVVRDFLVVGNTWDSTDGEVRDRVRWCAQGNPTDWTVNPVTGADVRTLRVGGAIQGIVGGSYGLVLSEEGAFRITWTGSPTWFSIDQTLPGIGTISPGAFTRLGDAVFICSQRGFFRIDSGQRAEPLGGGKVDEFFQGDLDTSFLHRMSAVADPRSGRIFWAYPGADNTNGAPNRLIVYDTKLNRWSLIKQALELVWSSAESAGLTLEDLDSVSASIDDLGVSLDSPQWKGQFSVLSAFNSAFEKGNFTGSPMTARILTREVQVHNGRLTHLSGFETLVDGGTTTVRVATRNKQSESPTFGNSIAELESGKFPCLANGKFHRFELTCSGEWKDAIGVIVNPEDGRAGARRG